MKGTGKTPLQVNGKDAVTGLIRGFITILTLISLSAWNAPLSQPRNVIGGHFISALTGIVVLHLFGAHPWTFALGTGLAICLMMLTKTTHPPAGAEPIVVIQGAYAWSYLVFPVLTGSVIIVILALVVNNLRKNRQYPAFWL
ncbi:HPP family protein [Bacillus subtilis]|nr:HPP family protein [Bacillus subtilis]